MPYENDGTHEFRETTDMNKVNEKTVSKLICSFLSSGLYNHCDFCLDINFDVTCYKYYYFRML